MIADYVGFHRLNGFLGDFVESWLIEFNFMTAVDALTYPSDLFLFII